MLELMCESKNEFKKKSSEQNEAAVRPHSLHTPLAPLALSLLCAHRRKAGWGWGGDYTYIMHVRGNCCEHELRHVCSLLASLPEGRVRRNHVRLQGVWEQCQWGHPHPQ
jgi:hypothetical protein